RFYFTPQLGIAAGRVLQKCGALFQRKRQGGVKHLFDPAPAIVTHTPAWVISRLSHALARLQSRSTVCVDTSKAAAVSSTERPPKNLISTTLALRASCLARLFNASSTAMK